VERTGCYSPVQRVQSHRALEDSRKPGLILLLGLLGAAGPLAAQAAPDSTSAPVVTRIELTRRNIFADSEATFFLPRLVNRLHVTTRPYVIERELLFQEGGRLDSLALSETARNLRRLGVFRTVRIDTVRTDSGMVMRIATQDGWSTKPELSFRSTGGQTAWRVSLTEENFLGTASLLLLGYEKDPDRSTFGLGFRQPRLIRGIAGVGLRYEDRSDGTIFNGYISKPYLSFVDREAWLASIERRDERILRYFEGEPVASDTLLREYTSAYGSYGWAPRSTTQIYHHFGVSGRVWWDKYTPFGQEFEPGDIQGMLGLGWEFRRQRYVVVTGFRASREEDVDLSTSLRAGVSISPSAWGFEENGVGVNVGFRTAGVVTKDAFAYLDLVANGRFTSSGLDSGTVMTGATLFYSPFHRHSLVAHVGAGFLNNPRPGGEFDLGLGLGPRGFQNHAFTGDRALNTTAEYRYMAALDFLKVMDVGVATFVDWGGAWYNGSKRRTGWDTGIGLRLGPSRATDIDLSRIDLVYRGKTDRDPGGWLIVIGRGLVFSTAAILTRN
jgi:hypothetical protein